MCILADMNSFSLKPSHLFNDGAEMVSEEFFSLQASEHVHLGGYELLLPQTTHLFNDGAEMVSEEFLSLQASEHVHLGGYELLLCSVVSLLCLQEIYNKNSPNNRAVDPDSMSDPDPAFKVNPDPDLDPIRIWIQSGSRVLTFDVQKLKEKNTAGIFKIFF